MTGREKETRKSEDQLFDLTLCLPLSLLLFVLAFPRSSLLCRFKANPKNPALPVSVCWVCLMSVTHTHAHSKFSTNSRGHSEHIHSQNTKTHTHCALFIENSKHRYYIIHSLMCHYVRHSICCLAFCLVLCLHATGHVPKQALHLMPPCYI